MSVKEAQGWSRCTIEDDIEDAMESRRQRYGNLNLRIE